MNDRLGVAAGLENMPLLLENFAKRLKVVNLAIVRNDNRAVLVVHGLRAGAEVDDREPTMSEVNPPGADLTFPSALAVGPSLSDARQHSGQSIGIGPILNEAGDAPHGSVRGLEARSRRDGVRRLSLGFEVRADDEFGEYARADRLHSHQKASDGYQEERIAMDPD